MDDTMVGIWTKDTTYKVISASGKEFKVIQNQLKAARIEGDFIYLETDNKVHKDSPFGKMLLK